MNDHQQQRDREILNTALERLEAVDIGRPPRWLLVDVETQRLLRIEGDRIDRIFRISTARKGIDAREGSGGTPPGVHRIAGKIGGGLPADTRFESREALAEPWRPDSENTGDEAKAPDLILSRILTLRGCETGINLGPGVDSETRYIYIHGTNHESGIGRPVSGGCIRMARRDVIELFDQIAEGDPLVIV